MSPYSPRSMAAWGLNVYLYAPKDDDKHRAFWRDLYTLEEANSLSLLIQECHSRGLVFVYAVAPGLDITFSSTEDVTLLKRKLDQVSRCQCNNPSPTSSWSVFTIEKLGNLFLECVIPTIPCTCYIDYTVTLCS